MWPHFCDRERTVFSALSALYAPSRLGWDRVG